MTFSWRSAAAIAFLFAAQSVSAQDYDYYSTPETALERVNPGYSLVSDAANRNGATNTAIAGKTAESAATANSATGACGCATACDGCGCGCTDCCCGKYFDNLCCCQPLWTVKAGIVYLDRANPHPAGLVENTVTGATIANAQNFNFNWNVGVDVSAIRSLGGSKALEVRYFGIDGWRATQNFTTSPIWNFPTDPPLFGLGSANIEAVYTSRLYSTEVNLRQGMNDRFGWLIGFRWLQVHENLNFDADFGGNQASITDNVDNNLYGGQLGFNWQVYNRGGPFRVDSVFKAGIFGNAANNTFGVTQQLGPAFGANQSRGQVAFVGEIGLTGVYQWTDHIALRGGYQVLWVEGIAVASDQLTAIDVLAASGIDSTGGAFYHGALASVDFTW
ncbi:MAG: BBP7 family outer membrane beta-barrel protein [Pirellulales bacterium]|nr:BBP7 family outer membrane beta-barrel protein [Pirellulales bacterium]